MYLNLSNTQLWKFALFTMKFLLKECLDNDKLLNLTLFNERIFIKMIS